MDKIFEKGESLEKIFNYFSKWVTLYELNNISNEGKVSKRTDIGINQLNKIFPIEKKIVLELGPLEAGHTILLHEFGAKKIISLEGRLENYLKCCVIKNIFNLTNAKFYLEDLREANLQKFGNFDVCICSGLLYHLPKPQKLIEEISKISSRVLINTHYAKVNTPKQSEVFLNGKKYSGSLYNEIDIKHPNSALQQYSFWFFKKDLIQVLKDVGYKNIKIFKDSGINQMRSPDISLYATKE